MSRSYDVVVIGGGSAAFEAAVAARQAGAERVLMLEKAPEAEYGGNARYSGTGFRFWHQGASEIRDLLSEADEEYFNTFLIGPYSEADFLYDLNKMTLSRIDQALAQTLVHESNTAVHWMKDTGIRFELLKEHAKVNGKRYLERGIAIHVAGGGLGQLQQWRKIAEDLGVEIRFNAPVTAIHGTLHGVEGVKVSSETGDYDIAARSIIACAGGFQASPEMRARYLVGNIDFVKVRGSKHDTGEVLRQLIALGAATDGQWQAAHMSPVDAMAPPFETPQHEDGRGNTQSRYDYPFGITVNGLGLRFFDEGEAQHSYTYAKTGRAVLGQPGSVAWQIYDQKGIRRHRYPHHKATFEEEESITALAQKIGIAPDVLKHTVSSFNNACSEALPHDPTRQDGKSTRGLDIPKSNWAVPIDAPPYRAYPVACGITFTFGGLKINSRAQVLNTMHEPIRGLYATGDIVGLFFHNYPSFTGQTRNAVFGRLAGVGAAQAN